MTIDITEYERSIVLRALIDYKHKIIRYAEMSDDDKDLLRTLYKDLKKLEKKLS